MGIANELTAEPGAGKSVVTLSCGHGYLALCLRSVVWGRHRAEAGERTVEVTKAQEARFPEDCRLTLFHQKHLFSSFTP